MDRDLVGHPYGLALRGLRVRLLGLAVAATALVASMRWSALRGGLDSEAAPLSALEAETILASNGYERSSGRRIGDGHYDFLIADVARETRHELASGRAASWTARVADRDEIVAASDGPAAAFDVTYPSPGDFVVSATIDGGSVEERVFARRVRRELRSLDQDELDRYLGALEVLYAVDDDRGARLYGAGYRSIDWFVREHLYGAADRACDHWHDGAGFVNHHVGITWQFEESLAAVDATLAAHYWDYTLDASQLRNHWPQSQIFKDDWFGSASPGNDLHAVDARADSKYATSTCAYSNGCVETPWPRLETSTRAIDPPKNQPTLIRPSSRVPKFGWDQ